MVFKSVKAEKNNQYLSIKCNISEASTRYFADWETLIFWNDKYKANSKELQNAT